MLAGCTSCNDLGLGSLRADESKTANSHAIIFSICDLGIRTVLRWVVDGTVYNLAIKDSAGPYPPLLRCRLGLSHPRESQFHSCLSYLFNVFWDWNWVHWIRCVILRLILVLWWSAGGPTHITGSLFGLDQGFHSQTPISRVHVPPPLETD